MVDNKLTIIYTYGMKTTDRILQYLAEHKSASGTDIARYLGISRQAVNKHLKQLVQQGMVRKEGVTKAALYFPASGNVTKTRLNRLSRKYPLSDLNEDEVFQEIDHLRDVGKTIVNNENSTRFEHWNVTHVRDDPE